MSGSTIAVAGASGDLGFRITRALVARGAEVRALVRPNSDPKELQKIRTIGATTQAAEPTDVDEMASALAGVDCVVSALNGLRDVIIDRQGILLDAAVKAGVPRFISSDYSEDFTHTRPGRNRNLDLRRDFMARADRAPIKVTSILNGAFMDILGAEMPIIQPRIRRVIYWGNADQELDFTTKDDVAAYTAAAALDRDTPRILRIAGDTVTARKIAELMSHIEERRYRILRAGSIGSMGALIAIAKLVAPEPGAPFPAWQGMQYMRDMMSGDGKLIHLDMNRYPDLEWTTVLDHLKALSASRER